MFKIASIIVIAAAVLACLAHLVMFRPGNRIDRAARELRRYSVLERLIHLAVTGSFVVLAITGFVPAVLGERLSGWWMMAHVAFGGVFAAAMAAMAVRWAHECRFEHRGQALFSQTTRKESQSPRFGPCQKALFWFAVLSGLVTTLTMMVSMTPLFGPEGIEVLLVVHQWSALGLLAAIIVHAYLQTIGRPGTWQSMIDGKVSRPWAAKFRPGWPAEK
jgi:formate dehydrogenase gamma subunit